MTTRSSRILALAAFMAVLIACGGGTSTPTVADVPATTADQDAPSTPPADGDDERELAPNFALTLEPEGEFVLSEAGKPVYLIFWAEW